MHVEPPKIGPDDPRYRAVVDKRFNKRFAERRFDLIGGGDELDVVRARGESLVEALVDNGAIPGVVGTDLWNQRTTRGA